MKRSGGGSNESSKKFKKSNLLLHQNSELALALKTTKQELAQLNSSHRKSNDRLSSRLASLDRAWKALNAHLINGGRDSHSIPNNNNKLASFSSLSRYVLANVNLNQEDDDEDEEGGDYAEMEEDDFERELKRRMQDTMQLLQQQQSRNGNSSGVVIAPAETLAARIELLKQKLQKLRAQVDLASTQLEEERTANWRLNRKLAHTTAADAAAAPAPVASPYSTTPQPAAAAMPQPQYQQHDIEQELLAMTEIASDRLDEIKQLQERNRQLLQDQVEAMRRYSSALAGNIAGAGVDSEAVQREVDRRELKTGRLAEEALEKLAVCEQTIQDLSRASKAISATQDSQLRKENSQLKQEVMELRGTVASLQQLKTKSQANDELIALLRNEKQALQQQQQHGGVDGDEGLINEIENLNHALNSSREANARLQRESEDLLRQLSEEKYSLEKDLRDMHEEKNLHVVRSERMQQILMENDAYVQQLQQQLLREKQIAERSEELFKRAIESCERAVSKQDEIQRQLDNQVQREVSLVDMEISVTRAKMDQDNAQQELNRANEELGQLRRKLERAKAMQTYLQEEAADAAARGGTPSSALDLRAQAMTNALRCPVYPHLWKDCVIIKCAHMFSRKCLEDNLANRNRRCPTCKNQYSKDDILTLYLYQSN